LHHRYLKYWDNDCAWWYNERTSTGLLAAAAWRPGEVALEEYSAEKGKRGRTYRGRVDLYFTNGDHDFIVEAKQAWVAISSGKYGMESILQKLELACRDVSHAHEMADNRLGVVYACPNIRQSLLKDRDRILKSWLKELKSVEADAICWVESENPVKLKGSDGHFYLGAALIARVV